MFDLAQVTDLHLVEVNHAERSGVDWQRLHYLSAGRRIDSAERCERALLALRSAGRNAAHVVLTGDLTEDGMPAQFELLAEVLHESGLAPERVTLVPGNHDRYHRADAFEQALAGPLEAYAATSSLGGVRELGREALLLPVSTAIAQSWLRSAGRMEAEDLERIVRLAEDARRAGKLALVVQHHPPHGYGGPAWNWIDGLLNATAGRALLCAYRGLQVLHGHTHKHASVAFETDRPAQAHSGAAVVTRSEHVRYYDVTREALIGAPPSPALPMAAPAPLVA